MSDYLNYLIGSASEHRTIDCHMSAISAYYEYTEKEPVGQHPYVCALLKGVLNQRLRQPIYVFTWDIQRVLEFIKILIVRRRKIIKKFDL